MKNKTNKTGAHRAQDSKATEEIVLSEQSCGVLAFMSHMFNAPSMEQAFLALSGKLTAREAFVLIRYARIESVARDAGYVPTRENILDPDTRFVKVEGETVEK